MKGRKLLTVLGSVGLVLVLVALALGGCVKPVAEAKPINIGYTTDFTGICAMFGNEESPAVKMAIEEANADGGINGRLIRLFVADDASDPTKVIANLKMFKERDKCVAIIGPVTSTVNIAAKAWAEENHIPIISPDPASDKLIHKEGKSWHFRCEVPNRAMVESSLVRAKELGYTKLGVQHSTLAWGTDVLECVKELYPKHGFELVGSVACEPKSKDLTIQARQLQDTGAEAVIMAEYPAETGVWARALKEIGWSPYIICTSGSCLANAMGMYPPELLEGYETVMMIDLNKPYLLEVLDKYEKYTGNYYVDEMVPRSWDTARILLEAIRLSGNPDDPEAIRDGIYKIKGFKIALGHPETMGSFEIGRNHLLTVADMTAYVIKSGKYEVAK